MKTDDRLTARNPVAVAILAALVPPIAVDMRKRCWEAAKASLDAKLTVQATLDAILAVPLEPPPVEAE